MQEGCNHTDLFSLECEALEPRMMLSAVQLFAAGFEGTEQIRLTIDNEIVASFSLNAGAENGDFETFVYNSENEISADQVKIEFINDEYDPAAGIDANVRLDAIEIDGERFETEDKSVYSTGTYLEADGTQPGFRESEVLHSNGFFRFMEKAVEPPVESKSVVNLLASGFEGTEQIRLLVSDVEVATYSLNDGAERDDFERFTYDSPTEVTADQVKVEFINDEYDPANGIDANVRLDAIEIDGERFETEDKSVFSTGTYLESDGTQPGFRESEVLHSNGYFQFADTGGGNTGGGNTEIIINARGEEGTEAFALEIRGVRVRTWENISTFTNSFVYTANGTVTADDIQIHFLNDRWEPELGIDANLFVDNIVVGGTQYETESPEVFSTGTWLPSDGIAPGNRQSEFLHGNGYFQYSSRPINGEGDFRLESSQYSISENGNAVEIRIIREGSTTGVVLLDYGTVDSTAVSGEDFISESGTLTFLDGEAEKSILVSILDDLDVEGDEQFGFTIDNVEGNANLSAPRTATVVIDDNDSIQGTGDGLLGEYFDNINLTNRIDTRVDAEVNFDWGAGSPINGVAANTFSVRWTGQIEPRFSENYTFATTSDDGVRLWIDDRLIIDRWNDHEVTEHSGQITLEAGVRYNIRMEHYENSGQAVARLAWSSDSQNLEFVPTSQLYSANDPGLPGDSLSTETVASGFDRPTSIDWSKDGQNLYVAEQGGVVYTVRNGTRLSTPFIDISDQVNGVRDRGLIDIAIHPDFETTPYVYLLFTYDPPEVFDNVGDPFAGPDQIGNRAGRLIRVTADAATDYTTAVAGSEVVLLGKSSTWDNFNAFVNSTNDFDEPAAGVLADGTNLQDFIASDSESHTVGALAFGDDGNLFVSIGDGTSFNQVDPRTVRVQDIDNLSGKVLRIDPIDGRGLSDNPFFNGDPQANRSKVYQYGLRNPFRMTVDPSTGQLFIGDVGWTQWEEINSGSAGANFGWPYFEGGSGTSLITDGYRELPEAIQFYDSGQTVTPAIYGLNHTADGINAIVMGDVYRGTNYPGEFQGSLFVNDLGQGVVRAVQINPDGTAGNVQTFATGANLVVQMKVGPDGNMHFVDLNDAQIGRWVFV